MELSPYLPDMGITFSVPPPAILPLPKKNFVFLLVTAVSALFPLPGLLPEALPGLVNAATITLITLVGYSAMGGAVGAGGLGQIGYQYGYIGYNATVMNTVLVLLVILVYLIQFAGDRIVRAVTRK